MRDRTFSASGASGLISKWLPFLREFRCPRGVALPSPSPSHQKSRRVALPSIPERKRRSTAGLALSSGSALGRSQNSSGESGTLERPFNAK
jgi:hypothetical protein